VSEIPSATSKNIHRRYGDVPLTKSEGATYTPRALADFVADQILRNADLAGSGPIRVLDPAVGAGELLLSLLGCLRQATNRPIEVLGFEKDAAALAEAKSRILRDFPDIEWQVRQGDFLAHVAGAPGSMDSLPLFATEQPGLADLIIANPPYVRTQIMGAQQAQALSETFGLEGRVDLYFAFLIGMARVLAPGGTAGVIVSNRFMSTRAGGPVRQALRTRFELRSVYDLGDTKLFSAAVLPAVLVLKSRSRATSARPSFTKVYETDEPATHNAATPLEALTHDGVFALEDGRHLKVQTGLLDAGDQPDDVWRIASDHWDAWIAKVTAHTWGTFRDIGKIRVGVKTCADKVFIRNDWQDMPERDRPELLRPLTTHHVARRFRPLTSKKPKQILYPHEQQDGRRRVADIEDYPNAKDYLEQHREVLEKRTYVRDAGRRWYELWVPQEPAAWLEPKLVFRDISEKPTFWIDLEGTVINGDCYWLIAEHASQQDLLWLAAAVANSSFIEAFYDHRFNNKLYAGRRRFMTQYVEQFPLPDPKTTAAQQIIRKAKTIFELCEKRETTDLERDLDQMIWKAFGLA
jgi:adenine-specific DNA-methyltransferase